jgi:hypothetical protein
VRASPLRQAVACLAGAMAEARFTGEPVQALLENSARTDHKMALDALEDLYPFATAMRAAQTLVEMQWHNIEALAGALLEREMSRYDEALRVLLAARRSHPALARTGWALMREKVLECRAAHPYWGVGRIAWELGQASGVVDRIFYEADKEGEEEPEKA